MGYLIIEMVIKYEGDFINDKKEGKGKMKYNNGEEYKEK